ncbi:MAG: patatin-like phospholipase family protein [Hyphomicrobiaceae bacterium]|nr:patatin-like phospholipase family protein [Hyphomicrobiaceae bacterium]
MGRKNLVAKAKLNLALQGGGAHGAFTWGVLDRILEDETIEIGWISGTSAGALNAVALAVGLAEGGADGSRRRLASLWGAIGQAGDPEFLKLNPWLAGLSRSVTLQKMAQLFSPYEINPLGIDPLRKVLEAQLDLTLLRTTSGPELLIAATHMGSGVARLFKRQELTIEAVLASACLPMMQHAVEIDGVAYWDGGFSANPDVLTLARESSVQDTLIVQLAPLTRDVRPTSARDITGHMYHLMFNQPYVRELEAIAAVQRRVQKARWRPWRQAPDADQKVGAHRFHLIEAGRFTGGLSIESRGKPEIELLSYLFSAGRQEAGKWLDRNRSAIGVRDTAEIAARLDAHRLSALGVANGGTAGAHDAVSATEAA